ncbi:PorP/SprF family type IX secretion system membrane protein [Pontibacter harenae]|uniref:PorP/SprF family type IX secretion system membrane protein n=1 Tax=Pontibacter harenae TaxID=2894083 RepID=UPI001E5FA747|nr:type IX secretion system membrane protein PorP/SprF [Pontibacter harenae]MCC9167354.1 type IX secretion system membrane protein PorP/SprF [Pontibacter harenae]
MKLKRLLLLVGVVATTGGAYAQQAPQYTQYIFNEQVINPAYTGSKEVLTINATHRSQWAGIEGAPVTQTLSVDAANKSGRLGWGLNVLNDELGVQKQTGAYANLAVRLKVGQKARLALGFAGGMSQYTLDGTKLRPGFSTTPDAAVPQSRESEILPDAKAGLFFNTERFYTGFSVANLIPFKGSNLLVAAPRRHYFLSSGYVFDFGPKIKLKPSFLIKEDMESPTNVDLNSFVLLSERLWLGASYRTSMALLKKDNPEAYDLDERNAWAAIAQIYVTPKLRVGYSYDKSLNALKNYASHEVSLGYTFFKKDDSRMLTPRYF